MIRSFLDPTTARTTSGTVDISVLIPVYDEAENVDLLWDTLRPALEALDATFEVVFVNDGSRDETESRLSEIAARDRRVRVINFRRNLGQTAAMMAGIDHARGRIVVPMDGDLQNDPTDIGRLVARLDDGFDVVSGWRRDRQDNFVHRTLPSRVANWLISTISGVRLNDYGCTLKAYRREVLQGFRLYGEMHRFVPIYAHWQGGRLTEMPVAHHPRRFGRSKYGLNRVFKVVLDLMVVKFLTQYATKPIYVFGLIGLVFMALAVGSGLYAVYLKLAHDIAFIQTPLPLLVTLSFITGVMCMLMGLLAEIMVRVYFALQGESHYPIKSKLNFEGPREDAALRETGE